MTVSLVLRGFLDSPADWFRAAADALTMTERPDTTRVELAAMISKLASAVNDVAHVADCAANDSMSLRPTWRPEH
ncbi:hypothetical protein GCM10017776_06730 [Streptomyces griseoluteus]|nr:hypothetical protein GCM10017776_06730 [Streptomyces griseoluteus]